jgi:hypothetical protein
MRCHHRFLGAIDIQLHPTVPRLISVYEDGILRVASLEVHNSESTDRGPLGVGMSSISPYVMACMYDVA